MLSVWAFFWKTMNVMVYTKKKQKFTSRSFRGWEVQDQDLKNVGVHWQSASWFPGVFLLQLHLVEEQSSPLRVLFVRALILFMKALPQCPNHLRKAPPPSASTLGVRIPHVNVEELKLSDHSRCIFWQSIQSCMPQTLLSVSYWKPFNLKKCRDKKKDFAIWHI